MIEVKIPVDVDAMQIKNKSGLTPKVRNYAIIGVVTIIPLALFGDMIMHSEVANVLIMVIMGLICIPIYLEGNGKTGISGEEMLMNIIHFAINKQRRPYEYLDPIAQLEEQEETERKAASKSKKSKRHKK